ncbi:hypothetical protein M9Y10_013396 [Tritrichomonas musculus]|uniref:Uncharacterized protein n=1 Tax=Tritrichomonas musculus TaxID=1915356 RepID=A0ABR2GNK2_9EUKA
MSTDKHFDYADDFEIKPDTWNRYNWDKYPSDIKRIWSSCDGAHIFSKRLYFFSPSYRIVYQIGSDPLRYQERGDDTHVYCLIDNNNKRYSLYVNDRLLGRIKNMNKIELPKKK